MQDFKHLQHQNLNWYHFDKPLDGQDQKFLSDTFPFSIDDLEYCQAKKSPRPRINPTSKYLYFIFHIPYMPPTSRRFSICELNVFITKTSLITVESKGNLKALDDFFQDTDSNQKLLETRLKHGTAHLFSQLLLEILSRLETHIDKQGEDIDRLHQEVFENRLARKFVEDVSAIRYNQVVCHNALKRQLRFYNHYRLDQNPLLPYQQTRKTHWVLILETFQAILYELESDMDHLEGLVKTFESLVTFRTNEIIKVLTTFSVILLPLTLLSGIYGMNFSYLPLAEHPFGVFITLFVMIIIGSGMAFIFRYKRWL